MVDFYKRHIDDKIKQNNVKNVSVDGFIGAIRGMRNPMNSHHKSDSSYDRISDIFILGEDDKRLCMQLIKAGSEHCKFMRFINISLDVTFPLYLWKEFDTYKFVEKNSTSTMHKITSRNLEKSDFACIDWQDYESCMLEHINKLINIFNGSQDSEEKREVFYKIIEILPSSYLQERTISLNYNTLRNIYHQRKNHKLIEWRAFCEEIKKLPYSEMITESFK